MSAPKEMRTLAAAKWPSSRDKELTTRCLPWGMSGRSRIFICGVHEAHVCADVTSPTRNPKVGCERGVGSGVGRCVGRCVWGAGGGVALDE